MVNSCLFVLIPPLFCRLVLRFQDCTFYFDMDEDGQVDWTTPHVLFENRAIVDFSTDPKTGRSLISHAPRLS